MATATAQRQVEWLIENPIDGGLLLLVPGGRLPTELEWERAARGVDSRQHPWGDEWDQGKCRNASNRGSETTCGVWEYPQGCSLWGHYQMSGNVWEWCEDWYDYQAYARYKAGDLGLPSGSSRVLRGGSWCLDRPDSFRCARRTTSSTRRSASSSSAFVLPGLLHHEPLPLYAL